MIFTAVIALITTFCQVLNSDTTKCEEHKKSTLAVRKEQEAISKGEEAFHDNSSPSSSEAGLLLCDGWPALAFNSSGMIFDRRMPSSVGSRL